MGSGRCFHRETFDRVMVLFAVLKDNYSIDNHNSENNVQLTCDLTGENIYITKH